MSHPPLSATTPAADHLDEGGRWRRFVAALPMRTALVAVGVVWLLGCVWSFQEQSGFAASKGFTFPHLLPLVIDGFAISMAGVSWAASLDARPALPARVATLIAVTASSASNGAWAYLRTAHDLVAVALGMAVPIAANLAFEVLLAELRRQVQRRRGLPAPVAIPYPRVIRLVLSPGSTFRVWRQLVLELTALEQPIAIADGTPLTSGSESLEQTTTPESGPERPRGANTGSDRPAPLPPDPAPRRDLPDSRHHSLSSAPATSPLSDRAVAAEHRRPLNLAPAPSSRPGSVHTSAPAGDPRAVALAQRLAAMDEPDAVTGSQVGAVLGLDIAPRTGRRLLGQARQLLRDHRPDTFAMAPEPRLTAHR
jgi:hypothetical protein